MPDDPKVPAAPEHSTPTTAAPPPPQPPKPQPKNPGLVTLTIDGTEVVCKPGTNLIEAAHQIGTQIPFYCYHKRLSIAANCRMCLVKVSNTPKLVPGCQTTVSEGLKVDTQSAEVMDSHRSVQEFLLYNHPVDCAICDQAGECKLQDYYMQFDHKPARPTQPKVLRHKRKELGPTVVLDQERCIQCTRCVRFMREIPKEPQLGVFGRGNREYIDIFPGVPLTSNYAGNVVDICPVGALLSRDFRFKARAFFLSATPSVCAGCSRGCNTFLDHYDGVSYRYRPRENEAVNQSWMCDEGRATVHRLVDNRVLDGRDDAKTTGLVEAVVAGAVSKLDGHAKTPGIAVVVSPQLSNEDLLVVLLFAKEGLGVSAVYASGLSDGKDDHLLLKADKNPNRKGLEQVAKAYGLTVKPFADLPSANAKALYVAGAEVPKDGLLEQALAKANVSVVQAFNQSAVTAAAGFLLPAAPHGETDGSFTNFDGRVQRFRQAYAPRGHARPHWRLALELWIGLGYAGRYRSAREVFLELGQRVPEFAKINWDDLGPGGTQPPGLGTVPAAADARPAGYRERIVQLKPHALREAM